MCQLRRYRFVLVLPLLLQDCAKETTSPDRQPKPEWTVQRTLTGHTDAVSSVAITPDGGTLVSGSADRTIKVWRLSDGALLRTLTGYTSIVHSVAISPDGGTLAWGGEDNTIQVWRATQ